ncbi:hypothetical protein D9M69_441040 [compost metagenome]
MLYRQLGDGALHQSARIEDLPGFLDTGAGHHGATIGSQQHHAFMGKARQGASDDGAADAENLTQGLFAQLGSGSEALFENGIENMRVDDVVLSAAAGAFGSARLLLEWLQLFVHGCSRKRGSAIFQGPFCPFPSG